MEEEEVVYLKVFDKYKGDVVFEGKVSTDVEPHELMKLTRFWNQGFYGIYNKAAEEVKSFKGLQNDVELVAGPGDYEDFSGVLYVGADDKVLRKSESVPSCECVMMSVWYLTHEECEKAFKCETLEELEMYYCKPRQIAEDIGKMKKLKKLRLVGMHDLKSIPEEMGELSNLEELRTSRCGIESLPKGLKKLKSIIFDGLYGLQLSAEDLAVFSRLKHLKIKYCNKVFTAPFRQLFWQMIISTTDLRVLDLDWWKLDEELVAAALEENGSIVDGGENSALHAHFFKRNKENHERAMECVVLLLAIRRWRDVLNNVPKEMVRMISMMLWITRCDVGAWKRSPIE